MPAQRSSSAQLSLATDRSPDGVFARIRNYLAGRAVGLSTDRALLHEVAKCLFARAAGVPHELSGTEDEIARAYRKAFAGVRQEVPDLFGADEELLLDPGSITFVHRELTFLDTDDVDTDPLGSLYQAFVSADLRMADGQFFTPPEAVQWLVDALDPQAGETVIDPACGSGGFLSYVARRWASQGVSRPKIADCLHGVEKDQYLASLARTHITLTTLKRTKVVCGDSIDCTLLNGSDGAFEMTSQFDVLLTNPPFGARIRAGSTEARRRYDLAHKWSRDRATGVWSKGTDLSKQTSPQILFVERCVQLVKPGGRLGMVVPESLLTSTTAAYVVQWLMQRVEIEAVVGMPEALFKTSGKGGTHTKTCLLVARRTTDDGTAKRGHKIFMAEAKWCGHDSRGKQIPRNDLPEIQSRFQRRAGLKEESHLGYSLPLARVESCVLSPRYYDPETSQSLEALRASHEIVSIGELVEEGLLSISTGDEIGKLAYGTGEIPFVRTSDISNWEIKISPKHCVADDIYERLRRKQDVREGDILMVRDGTYLIGECAYVSKYDERIVFQSHLYKLRMAASERFNPFLLLALLSCDHVKRQIQAKRFTQDIIDSLGKRVLELLLPVPRSRELCSAISGIVRKSIADRIEARELARQAALAVADIEQAEALANTVRASSRAAQSLTATTVI